MGLIVLVILFLGDNKIFRNRALIWLSEEKYLDDRQFLHT